MESVVFDVVLGPVKFAQPRKMVREVCVTFFQTEVIFAAPQSLRLFLLQLVFVLESQAV